MIASQTYINETASKEEFAIKIVKLFFPSFIETERFGMEDQNNIDGYIGDKSVQVKADLRMADTGNLYLETSYFNDHRTWWHETEFHEDIRIHVSSSFLIWVPMSHLLEVAKKYSTRKFLAGSKGKLIPISCLAPNYKKIPIPSYLGFK